jgi:hypothetical protein
MSNLSYLILHFNRPFLLEANIHLVRKYAPAGTQIIIADDGSDPDVIRSVKKMDIDDIFVQKKNKNTTTVGTCSDTIKSGRKLCKNEYFLFSEDDFFLSGGPIESWRYLKNEEVMPRVSFIDAEYNIFEKSMAVLAKNPKIKNIQLGRDPLRVPVAREFEEEGLTWHYVDHAAKGGCYYCNWPNLSRLEDHERYKIPEGLAIWSLEGKMANGFADIFGRNNWAVVPTRRYYWHVGTAFSKRLNSFSKSKKRQISMHQVQKTAFGGSVAEDLESFNKMILKAWKDGAFRIDLKELVDEGLAPAFQSAFERLRNHIEGKNV